MPWRSEIVVSRPNGSYWCCQSGYWHQDDILEGVHQARACESCRAVVQPNCTVSQWACSPWWVEGTRDRSKTKQALRRSFWRGTWSWALMARWQAQWWLNVSRNGPSPHSSYHPPINKNKLPNLDLLCCVRLSSDVKLSNVSREFVDIWLAFF